MVRNSLIRCWRLAEIFSNTIAHFSERYTLTSTWWWSPSIIRTREILSCYPGHLCHPGKDPRLASLSNRLNIPLSLWPMVTPEVRLYYMTTSRHLHLSILVALRSLPTLICILSGMLSHQLMSALAQLVLLIVTIVLHVTPLVLLIVTIVLHVTPLTLLTCIRSLTVCTQSHSLSDVTAVVLMV